ncbi:MAG: sulfotransferase, partial [Xanthomonadales bacterium]|nr:sulfotransferase [Xanthomonadales bacterium]
MAHPLSGADIGTLRRVMGEADRIDRRGRALGIWASVLGRLPFTTMECILVGRYLPKIEEMAPPIFILGHWRSGTTHLYNVM